jgi:solute carrier family 32 (vesicular inhibitory amino acid transporter)
MGRLAYGHRHRIIVSLLFSLELTATWYGLSFESSPSVALVVLFADSLHVLFPDVSATMWKVISFLIFIPLSFIPLNILSYTSILGILGTIGCIAF